MLRGLWQSLKDTIYDSVSSLFRSQEDIDIIIENELMNWGAVVYDAGDIDPAATYRKHEFWSHKDAIAYVKRGGIPGEYVTFLIEPDADEEGNTRYTVWVKQ